MSNKAKSGWVKLWQANRGLIIFIGLMLVFRSAVADWNEVPTGSMQPTIVEGDRIWVDKMAYDLRVPFTHISLAKLADPQRGDIVIFDSEVAGKRLVKRVVGLPGEKIEMRNNRLRINGEPLNYSSVGQSKAGSIEAREYLAGRSHLVRLSEQGSRLSNFAPVEVPADHYLVLGDNRDRSADSRVIGFVPRDEIVGRSQHVVLSRNYDNYSLLRSERFFKRL